MTYKTLEDLLKELNVQADPFKTYKTPKQWLKELNVQADPSIIARLIADAQRWLDLKYPVKQEVKEIIHDNEMEKSLIGELVIKDFPKLKKISFIGSGDIFKIEIVNCPQLDDFECVGSPVKEIDFGSSNKLERIYIPDNLLESIKLPANPTGLVKLSVHNNKLSSRTLQTLAPFTKNIPLPFGAPDDMTMTYYEYSAKDKEKLKNILSKQESQTTESSSSSTISQIQPKKESEKKSVAQLEKEHTFYKNFFDNYLQNKKTELIKLKDKMGKEDKKQLDDYLQLKQSEDKNKNRERKLKKCLLKKLYSEELLQKILDINKEINKLENQVNEIELKSKIAVPQTS